MKWFFFLVTMCVLVFMLTVQFVFWLLCCSIPSVQKSSAFLSKNPEHGKIVGVGSVESSFLYQTTRCIDSFDHPDLAPIMVFLECLTTLEVSCPDPRGWSPYPPVRRINTGEFSAFHFLSTTCSRYWIMFVKWLCKMLSPYFLKTHFSIFSWFCHQHQECILMPSQTMWSVHFDPRKNWKRV